MKMFRLYIKETDFDVYCLMCKDDEVDILIENFVDYVNEISRKKASFSKNYGYYLIHDDYSPSVDEVKNLVGSYLKNEKGLLAFDEYNHRYSDVYRYITQRKITKDSMINILIRASDGNLNIENIK